MNELTEGIHYYFNDEGYVVLTQQYHLERGYCCGNGCLHCPFNYESVPEPKRSEQALKPPKGASENPE